MPLPHKNTALSLLALLAGLTFATGCDKLMAKEKDKKAASADDDDDKADDDDKKKDKGKSKDKDKGDDEAASKKPLEKAPAMDWKDDDELKLGKATGRFSVSEKLAVRLALYPVPKGTKVTAGSVSDVAGHDNSQVLVDVDVAEQLGKMNPDEAFSYKTKWKSGIKFTIALAGHEPLEVEAPGVATKYGLQKALEGVKNRPVIFGKEAESALKEHSVVYLATLTPKVFGPAKTLTDIDWVAIHEDLPSRKGKMCPGYKDDKGGKNKSLPIEMQDRDVVIYERKTAKEIARKKFEAAEKCPMFALGDTAKTYPNEREIETWLRSERGKK